jgi:hypothetical protein
MQNANYRLIMRVTVANGKPRCECKPTQKCVHLHSLLLHHCLSQRLLITHWMWPQVPAVAPHWLHKSICCCHAHFLTTTT